MAEFHQHPDGWVFVRTDGGTYCDTRENFEVDYGQPLPPLPEGADEHVYTQGKRHCFMGGGDVIEGGPMPYDYGDDAIQVVGALLAKQRTRASRT